MDKEKKSGVVPRAVPTAVRCLLVIVAALVFLEVLFRFCGVRPKKSTFNPEGPFLKHETLGWVFKSNFKGSWSGVPFETNAAGLREAELPKNKAPGETHILLLAGSTATGVSLEQKNGYPQVLEDELRAAHKNVRVLNAGIPGYSTQQELTYFKEFGLSFEPDLVILDFALNDVLEGRQPEVSTTPPLTRPVFRAEDGYLRLGPEPVLRGKILELAQDLPQQTSLYTVLRWPMVRIAAKILGHGAGHRQIEQEVLSKNPSLAVMRGWEETQIELREILTLARSKNLPIIIMMFPIAQQLQNPSTASSPQQIMTEFCAKESVPFINLLPAFANAANKSPHEPLFIDADHPTTTGSRIAAHVLAQTVLPLLP